MQISGFPTRSSSLLASDQLLAALQRTQVELDRTQNEIASGKSVDKPSDDPGKVAAILTLQKQLEARTQYERNMEHASGILNTADQALADYSNILIEAREIALSQIGIGSDAATREAEAAVIASQVKGLIEVANRDVGGVYLFGGAFDGAGPAFSEYLGGVMYNGGLKDISADAGLSSPLSFNINGADAFNLASGKIIGAADLDPQATSATRLSDVSGTAGRGIRLGTVSVMVDAAEVNVDLTQAKTLGDVVTRINAAIDSIDPTAGSLAISGAGFALTAAAGRNIDVSDIASGHTASDLGIEISANSATTQGGDVNVRLTSRTTLASLGASVDLTSGLVITQGNVTKTADLSNAETIQDVANILKGLELGIELQINDAGDGINILNRISGTRMTVGENGGTTASDLGIRTFDRHTKLSTFNDGTGVSLDNDGDDLSFSLHDGTTFTVDLDGATTVGEVLDAVEAAATNAGLTFGAAGDFNISLAENGNGFVVEDNTAGGNDFEVANAEQSLAAEQLGIKQKAGSGSTVTGEDRAKTRVESIFTFLNDLHDSLVTDDSSGISLAESGLELMVDQLSKTRADVGMRTQRVERELERSTEMGLTEQSLLSQIQDADLTEVITRFAQLQTQLQATLQVGAQRMRLSLLDFLG